METLDSLETADESSGNSGMVKSEDGSPNHGSGRSSPPPNCAICLGRCRNKSFTDSCLHQFCFKCLLTWSRVKTECPLCKQNFKSIIHNVKSNHQYEEYRVQQPQSEERGPNLDFSDIFNAARRFRYRTTLTLPRRETMAIRQFLLHYPLSALMNELPARGAARDRTRRSPADFRRTVYRHNLWARPLPDFTGRFRDCSPDFFRYNDSQVHRLVPWLSRELFYLLNENGAHVTYVLGRILELLPQHPILSEQFRGELQRYLGDRTHHFLHEFHCFASTPYDITGYDRHVQYHTDERLAGAGAPGLVSEVLSSSDSDSRDSDIVVVSSSHAAEPPAPAPGPSREPAVAPAAPPPAYPQPAVIPIETISHSDSDSDSEVMVVGYIKPPHQRTPELVDLLASDSDVVVQEPDEPAPAPAPEPLVRIKLSVRRSPGPGGERPAGRRRRRARAPAPDAPYSPVAAPRSSSDGEYDSVDSTSTSDAPERTKRTVKKKSKRKSTRGSRSRARADGRESRRSKETKKSADGDRRTKGKSRNGKDVKSSKVEPSETPVPSEPTPALDRAGPSGLETGSRRKRSSALAPPLDEPGPSGLENGSKRMRYDEPTPALDRPGPSGLEDRWTRKRSIDRVSPPDRDRDDSGELASGSSKKIRTKSVSRRSSRETRQNKRLKSIVKVMKRDTSTGADSSESRAGPADAVASSSTTWPKNKSSLDGTTASRSRTDDFTSSSDDNIPLRLALTKPYTLSRTHVSDFSDW